MKRTTLALLLACCLMAAAAPSAWAGRGQETIFDATNDLLLAESEQARQGILDELQDLGVDIVRIVVPWRAIVPAPDAAEVPPGFDPADPADYSGGELNSIDQSVRGATARGMRVLLTPSAPIPDWASLSGASALADPMPSAFEQLLVGLGRRYGGSFGSECSLPPDLLCLPGQRGPLPRVGFWSVWNEPNLDLFLRPQYRRGKPVAGNIYRRLFLAAQAGLRRSGHGADPVLIGETSPSSGERSTAPLDFLAQALCLTSRSRLRAGCRPLSAAGWAHHPYDPFGSPIQSSAPWLLGIPALKRLTGALGRAAAGGATIGRLPVYVTEYGVESIPDPRGVSLARQAEYLGLGEYLLWLDPAVRSYGQYLLHDDRVSNRFSFQSGLRTEAGATKPSYDSFRVTLVVRRRGSRLILWGHLRPGSGSREVVVEARSRRGLRELARVYTDEDGYFTLRAPAGNDDRWRASAALPGGPVLSGPLVRSFRF